MLMLSTYIYFVCTTLSSNQGLSLTVFQFRHPTIEYLFFSIAIAIYSAPHQNPRIVSYGMVFNILTIKIN